MLAVVVAVLGEAKLVDILGLERAGAARAVRPARIAVGHAQLGEIIVEPIFFLSPVLLSEVHRVRQQRAW